jgi:hypothetical protein
VEPLRVIGRFGHLFAVATAGSEQLTRLNYGQGEAGAGGGDGGAGGLGTGRRQVVVPAQSGRAVRVSRGDLVQVVDIEGHQVGDLWAVDAADHGRWLSASHTRDRGERLFPAVGGVLCDQRGDADGSHGVIDNADLSRRAGTNP